MSKQSLLPLDVLLGAIEEAQDELLHYLDPGQCEASVEVTIAKLTHILGPRGP